MPDSFGWDRYPRGFRLYTLWMQLRDDEMVGTELYTADFRVWMVEAKGITAGIILN